MEIGLTLYLIVVVLLIVFVIKTHYVTNARLKIIHEFYDTSNPRAPFYHLERVDDWCGTFYQNIFAWNIWNYKQLRAQCKEY